MCVNVDAPLMATFDKLVHLVIARRMVIESESTPRAKSVVARRKTVRAAKYAI